MMKESIITIPKSMTHPRIESSFKILDFELDGEEMEQIDLLNENYRSGPDPLTFDF